MTAHNIFIFILTSFIKASYFLIEITFNNLIIDVNFFKLQILYLIVYKFNLFFTEIFDD